MAMRVDEILEALPEVGLQIWMLCDNGAEGWYCVLHDRGGVPEWDKVDGTGRGPTALEALVAACDRFGVKVDDV